MSKLLAALLGLLSSLAPLVADVSSSDSPDALYMQVLQSQGLYFPGVKPWHLKASYTVFDSDGKHPANGVFEEWWMGPHKYKLSYRRSDFSQTDYATDAGLYRQGEQAWPHRAELWIPIDLMEAMPDLRGMKELTFRRADFTGQAQLRCLTVSEAADPYPVTGKIYPTYCIDPKSPVLRLSSPFPPFAETVFNRILGFQGHYIAGDIKTNAYGKTIFQLTIDSLEVLASPEDRLFTPPPDAVLLPKGPVPLSMGSMQVLKEVAPNYSSLAQAEHFEGTVRIQAVIGPDGHVRTAKVIDGPRILQQAALDAVYQWIFRPFLVSGEPVEVNAETGMGFKLSR